MVGNSPWGRKESDTTEATERAHTHTHTHTHMLHMKVAKGVNAELSSQEMRDFQCLILHECEKMDVH